MAESSTISFQGFPESYYSLLQNKEHVVFLETTQYHQSNAYSLLFLDPIQILQIHRISELEGLLASISTYRQQGYYLAGYFAYECGYHIKKLGLSDYHHEKQPLAWFGVYQQPLVYDHRIGAFQDMPGSVNPPPSLTKEKLTHTINDIAFDLDEDEYHASVERIKEYIRAGDVYQVNFTGRYAFTFDGSPLSLYQALKKQQPVSYSAYIRAAGQDILCFSPELFFCVQGQHILARPMKGTAPRGHTNNEDRQMAEWLAADTKNRAENVMIVDLLRNDLGQLCQVGSVTVPHLFSIEKYATLFQMTSTVEGRLKADLDYSQLFRSLFPCGSITGAPKIRAMEIIKELEQSPRGIYTGSIGYFAPSLDHANQAASAIFNVAIRTIVLENGRGEMGVGSGITSDSLASTEYAECAIKAHFLTSSAVEFDILEAILWDGWYQRLEKHMQRMADSAAYFDYPCDLTDIQSILVRLSATFVPSQRYKVRLKLKRSGECSGEALQLQPQESTTELYVVLSSKRTNSQNCMYYHKTTERTLYDRASRLAQEHGYTDVIFLNEKDEVTEGATNNIFIEHAGQLLTPPLCCGLLNGIYRQSLLEKNHRAREEKLSLDDLLQAEKIYICNAIRGLRSVKLKHMSAL